MMVVSWTPLGRFLAVLGTAAALGAAVLAGYLWAHHRSELDRNDVDDSGGRMAALELELEDAGRRLADANLAREVDRQALAIQREAMGELQDSVRELREQLEFYRRLLDTSAQGGALQVADFEVIGREDSGASRFRVLLTRPTEQGDWISGSARLEVAGLNGGGERELFLPDVSGAGPSLDYRFRYFQRLSGSLTLPAGFRPLRVTVKLFPRGENSPLVERTFDWPDPS